MGGRDQILEENSVLIVQELENLTRGLVWNVFSHSEAARERRDQEGAINCERSLEDIESHRARVCDDDRWAFATVESSREDLLLEPGQQT